MLFRSFVLSRFASLLCCLGTYFVSLFIMFLPQKLFVFIFLYYFTPIHTLYLWFFIFLTPFQTLKCAHQVSREIIWRIVKLGPGQDSFQNRVGEGRSLHCFGWLLQHGHRGLTNGFCITDKLYCIGVFICCWDVYYSEQPIVINVYVDWRIDFTVEICCNKKLTVIMMSYFRLIGSYYSLVYHAHAVIFVFTNFGTLYLLTANWPSYSGLWLMYHKLTGIFRLLKEVRNVITLYSSVFSL